MLPHLAFVFDSEKDIFRYISNEDYGSCGFINTTVLSAMIPWRHQAVVTGCHLCSHRINFIVIVIVKHLNSSTESSGSPHEGFVVRICSNVIM